MSDAEKIKDAIFGGLAVIVLGTVVTGFGVRAIEQGKYERAWRAADKLADKKGDHNLVISDEEYNSIYRALGLQAPEKHTFEKGYALDLSLKQLRKYVLENE